MRKRISLPFFVCMIFACGVAPRVVLADGEGLYLSVAGGAMLLRGNDLDGSTNLDPDYSTGFAVGGGLGSLTMASKPMASRSTVNAPCSRFRNWLL